MGSIQLQQKKWGIFRQILDTNPALMTSFQELSPICPVGQKDCGKHPAADGMLDQPANHAGEIQDEVVDHGLDDSGF